MKTQRSLLVDRLIVLSLLSALAAALVAGEARANLPAAARAAGDYALPAGPADPASVVQAWRRLRPDALTGDDAIRLELPRAASGGPAANIPARAGAFPPPRSAAGR